MSLKEVSNTKCGGNFVIEGGRKKCFCQYCGTQILFDDGSKTVTNVNYIHDEARIKEAEARIKQLEYEYRLKEQELKRANRPKIRPIFRTILWFVSLLLFGLLINFSDLGWSDKTVNYVLTAWVLLSGYLIVSAFIRWIRSSND